MYNRGLIHPIKVEDSILCTSVVLYTLDIYPFLQRRKNYIIVQPQYVHFTILIHPRQGWK